ncbi:MAG: STAS domain-containing protein [Bacteroidales bacterium]|nr:STAS domain-containing protein [Bacteroidales bacterium]
MTKKTETVRLITFFKEIFYPKLFSSLRLYSKEKFLSDTMAGVIVGIVAIPLAIAFAIASGVGPTEGLITAVIAGFIISFFGGSKVQIGGPTGAFIVIIYGIIQQHGLTGLLVATIMAGVMLVLMGVFKLGSMIKFVPYPVIVGFTGGIALTIFSTQINDFFGLGISNLPADFIHKWISYFSHFTAIHWWSFIIALISLFIILVMPLFSKKIPGSLVAIILATILVYFLKLTSFAGVDGIKTIQDIYILPEGIPMPHLPSIALAENQTLWGLIQTLFPAAFTIAMLGAIESLLSAMVADGVIRDKHNSNTELIAQGMANIVVPFFGGIPATGAIARTMTNINNGAKTPIAGIIHAIVLLLVLLFLGKFVGYIPMACLAAVLIIVAYHMSGWRSFISLSKNPKSDFVVLMTTFLLTVIFDLTIAIEIGLLLAVVLFLKRTNEATIIRVFQHKIDPAENSDILLQDDPLYIPKEVDVYEIDGPYFFGIATKFDEVMETVGEKPKVRIIRMRKVSFIDSTGIHHLQNLCEQSHREKIVIILSGVNKHVRGALMKANFFSILPEERVCSTIHEALELSEQYI